MTPNIAKGFTDTSKFMDDPKHPANNDKYKPDSMKNDTSSNSAGYQSETMDGDHSAKTFDAGAASASGTQAFSDSMHEQSDPSSSATGEKSTGQGTSIFSATGLLGKQFNQTGNIGQIGEKVGGPLASDGIVGKAFTKDGAIGGTFQSLAEKNESH